MKKKNNENEQSTGHFQSDFFIFDPPDPNSETNSRKTTNKKSGLNIVNS